MIETVPSGVWTRAGTGRQVGLLLRGRRRGARRVGEFVDDDEAVARVLRAGSTW